MELSGKYIFGLLWCVCVFLSPNQVYSQWTQIDAHESGAWYGLEFLNSDTGFAGGVFAIPFSQHADGDIYKTTDGGLTWTLSMHHSFRLYDIFFVNDTVGFTCVGSQIQGGYIKKTTDAGDSWSTVYNSSGTYLRDLHFVSDSVGICVGDGQEYKTTDGGNTWIDLSDNYVPINATIFGLDEDTWFLAGMHDSIWKSTDGGVTWTGYLTGSLENITGLSFPTPQVGYASAYDGVVEKTTDGGLTWTALNLGSTLTFRDVLFRDEYNGIAVGGNRQVYVTSDGGDTWHGEFVPQNTSGYSWLAIDTLESGWIIAGSGQYMYKGDNLITDIAESQNLKPALEAYPNPTSDEVMLRSSSGFAGRLSVVDGSGRVVKVQEVRVSEKLMQIDLPVNSGVYFIQLLDVDGVLSQVRVVKN